jgi:cyclomaltodextrinase / maltogenic alpha-amylase / neopullulanase
VTNHPTNARPVFGEKPGSVDTPAWVRDAVFYQIFPDRFARSDKVVKPSGIEPWDTDPTVFGYKGGDLLGVVEKLDYLVDLGITALYLNPIFQSASNHRYHTHDYLLVDPLLGGIEAFDALLAGCKERGIRVVLDGVFNHASRGFFYFNDVLENGDASPWIDWFYVSEFPVNAYDHNRPPGYTAWFELHALPKLNTDNPQMREYIMQVAEYWTRKGIDGWRLDVPDEITTPGFWEEFRSRVRAINPDAYICAEIWHESPHWLQGEHFDSVMNYVFAEAALAFAGRNRIDRELQESRAYNPWPGIDGLRYADKIDRLLGLYDWNVQTVQMNLLDSHDTPRALTLASDDVRTLELATLLLFTFPGAPSVYYGDEIGLDGGLPDHWARRPFPWNEDAWDHDLRWHYQRLIALRRDTPALRTGTYQALAATERSYAFIRQLEGTLVVVALNTSDNPDAVVLPVKGLDEPHYAVGEPVSMSESNPGVTLSLPARSGAIWVRANA